MAIAGTPFESVTITQFNLFNHALDVSDDYYYDGQIRAQVSLETADMSKIWVVEYDFSSASTGLLYGSGVFMIDEVTETIYSSVIDAAEIGSAINFRIRARELNSGDWSDYASTSANVPNYATSATVVPDGVTISGPTKSIFDSSTSSTLVLDWDWTNGVRYQIKLSKQDSLMPVFSAVLYGNSDQTPYTISGLEAGTSYQASILAIESGKLISASLSTAQLIGSTTGIPSAYVQDEKPLFATKAAADAVVANYRIGQIAMIYDSGTPADTGVYLKTFTSVAGSGSWTKIS